ncbi:MAG: uroporphyrinogen decarboxylase family protein [Saccharofermentanales bacterium]
MNSRERLMNILQHKMPDRIAVSTYEMVGWNNDPANKRIFSDKLSEYVHDNIDFAYMTGWHNEEPSYQPIMEYIREKTDCICMTDVDMVNGYFGDHTKIEQWKENDTTFTRVTVNTPKGDLTKLYRNDDRIKTSWQIEHMVKTDHDLEKYLSIPDNDLKPVDMTYADTKKSYLGDNGILMIDIADPLGVVFDLFHFGDFTVTAYTDKEIFTKMLDKAFEQQMFFLEDMLKKGAGPLFRIIGPEAATPPYLYTENFHDYVYKYDSKMIRMIHDYGQYARIHCHGKIRDVLPDIVRMETDAIDPAEAPPDGNIGLGEIKSLFGDKLSIFGNIQLKDIEFATPEQMRDITLKCIREGKPGGNFVLMPTATPINIPLSPVSERNIKIMIDTAIEYGTY